MCRAKVTTKFPHKNNNKGETIMAEEVKKDEDWMQKKWRPAMGWMYMIICTLDMGVFPVAWSLLQVLTHQTITQWSPLTLQGAGLFHLAMGAVLGIAAWGRTQEKVAGAASNGVPSITPMTPPSAPMTPPMAPPMPPMMSDAPTPPAIPKGRKIED
jgi:hypothetical protein